MKKIFLNFFLIAAAAFLCVGVSGTASAAVGRTDHTPVDYSQAAGWPEAPEIAAESAYMIELNSGAVLYDKDGEAQSYPASTTKIMTALLTLENCSLDEEVTFSYNAVQDIESGGHHYEFQEGEVLTVSECLQFLMVESVNEVGYALAEHISGSVPEFAELMNERAAELGATDTHFNNPHGLNDENHYTTARDMALILWGCVQSDAFRIYASRPSVSLAGRAVMTGGFTTYTNHDLMLLPDSSYYNPDVVCGKTGFTSVAGYTLVTYASRDGMDVICVLMKGTEERFDDMQKLLDYAFSSFQLIPLEDAVSEQTALPGDFALTAEVREDGCLLLPAAADLSDTTSDFTVWTSEEDGGRLGTKTWYYQGIPMGSATVILNLSQEKLAAETSEEGAGEPAVKEDGSAGSSEESGTLSRRNIPRIAVIVLVVLLILLILYILLQMLARSRRRRRRRRRKAARRRGER